MKEHPASKEPFSSLLRRHPHGSMVEIVSTVQWVAMITLAIFLTLIISNFILGDYTSVIVTSAGIIPIIISLILLQRGVISVSSTILAGSSILLITWHAMRGQGLYDIAVTGYPVVLIVAGLVLRGRVLQYLAYSVIFCLGWLTFGDYYNLYHPKPINSTYFEDFLIGGVIILVAGNAVYRLARNVYSSLQSAEEEIQNRKKAEADRDKVIQQLQRKNKELDRFALRVSHDLKSPLITIAGFLGYLERDIKSGEYERVERNFNQIDSAAKTMGNFVDELLDLSRVGRITNSLSDVPFDEILQDALKAVQGQLRTKQVQVEIESDFPVIHVDRVRIVQVVQNLLSNAIKFMGNQEQPRIRIGMEPGATDNVFFISDNGIGIESENKEFIFELFNKIDPNTEGTGIGLGLVKRIIEVHHGKIWVESEPGNGATFYFTLENKISKEIT